MIIQYESIGYAMQKVLRDINIQDNSLKNDLLGWVADALDMLNTTYQLIPQQKELSIVNYGTTLPCGVHSIQAVSYDGYRIRYGTYRGSQIDFDNNLVPSNYMTYWITKPAESIPGHTLDGANYVRQTIDALQAVNKLDVYQDLYYYTVGKKLETNLAKGTIQLYYLGTMNDADGFPLVPKNTLLLEAVSMYVQWKLTARGDMQGNWQNYYQLWEKFAVRAINDISFPTPETMHTLTEETLGFAKPDYYTQFI